MAALDTELTRKLLESGLILAVGLGFFLGLKGRIQVLAQKAKLPRLALTPVRLALRYAILAIAIFMILGRWGFETQSVIAVVGTVLGLVAIGFVAVWSVLSNFLCTLVLVIMKPFSIGDEIELVASGVKGKVIDLSMVFTTLQVAPNQTVLIPNNSFFQGAFRRHVGTVTVELDEQLGTHYPAQRR